jgi:hypothetical protein
LASFIFRGRRREVTRRDAWRRIYSFLSSGIPRLNYAKYCISSRGHEIGVATLGVGFQRRVQWCPKKHLRLIWRILASVFQRRIRWNSEVHLCQIWRLVGRRDERRRDARRWFSNFVFKGISKRTHEGMSFLAASQLESSWHSASVFRRFQGIRRLTCGKCLVL